MRRNAVAESTIGLDKTELIRPRGPWRDPTTSSWPPSGGSFALSHVPGWLVETGSLAMALVLVGLFALPHLASRVIVGWLYNGTGRSVLLVGLFHAAHNATVGAYGFARTFIPGSDEATLVMGSDIAPPRRC